MRTHKADPDSRRRFLQLLSASPLLPYFGLAGGVTKAFAQENELIPSAATALDVFDFEPIARKNLPPAHFAYLATGTDDDATIQANRDGFARYQLRVRRLVDVSKIDMSVRLLGKKWDSPIVLCPVGYQRSFHPEGEIAVARAAKAKGHLQVLSNQATTSVEDVNAARGEPVWFQLYRRQEWQETLQMVKRAERSGCPAMVFTVDLLGGSNRETLARGRFADSRPCVACHENGNPATDTRRIPMIAGLVPSLPRVPEVATPTWDYVKRLKDATTMKLFVKGIVTREDAELAMAHGVDGLFVSNHGGRAENSLRSTIECVPDVVAGVAGRAPVIVDSGFRRGTDIFKALALGATAVGIGRPYIWGLASYGQDGVESVLDILRRELQMVMRQAGTPTVADINKAYIIARS
jgi:4-hydroxymandelate oxidase